MIQKLTTCDIFVAKLKNTTVRVSKDGYTKDVYHFEACYDYASSAYF